MRSINVLIGVVLALAITASTLTPASSSPGTVISRDYPDALCVRQMARRGIEDFTAQHGRFPASIQQVQDLGLTAYLFPTNFRPELAERGGRLYISSFGRPAFSGGQSAVLRTDLSVGLTKPGLGTPVAHLFPDGVERTVMQWHFPGAEWLSAGHGRAEVETALRRDRIFTHLNWLTAEYQEEFREMPRSLADLEAYFGTERNLLCWQGVNEVLSPQEAGYVSGNLFAGWDHNNWVVSINNGIEVQTTTWKQQERGHYLFDSPGLVY